MGLRAEGGARDAGLGEAAESQSWECAGWGEYGGEGGGSPSGPRGEEATVLGVIQP